MDPLESLILISSLVFTFVFLYKWYQPLMKVWSPGTKGYIRRILGFLPPVSFVIYVFTLTLFASFDVVGSAEYIFFYLFLGFAWLYFSFMLMFVLFDLSWIDDVLLHGNRAALYPVTGAFLALTFIYAGANVGDGPGWWCVVFAGCLGLICWTTLAFAVNYLTKVFERVTVGRDIACGIRLGTYLLTSGIICGKASSGDWTSFYMTIVELKAGWTAIPLAVLVILVEYYYIYKEKDFSEGTHMASSFFWSIIYFVIAIVTLVITF